MGRSELLSHECNLCATVTVKRTRKLLFLLVDGADGERNVDALLPEPLMEALDEFVCYRPLARIIF